MARKSKETIQIEALRGVSDCPADIFEHIAYSDELIETIAACENGCKKALQKLIDDLISSFAQKQTHYKCILYLLTLGCRTGDEHYADCLVNMILTVNDGFELIDIINAIGSKDDLLAQKLRDAKVRALLARIESSEGQKEFCTELAALGGNYPAEMLYLKGYDIRAMESGITAEIKALAEELGVGRICSLPSYTGLLIDADLSPTKEEMAMEIDRLRQLTYLHSFSSWRDFWFRCLYEYVGMYCESSYHLIATDAINITYSRKHVKRHRKHALAWAKYAMDHQSGGDIHKDNSPQAIYSKLYDECCFNFEQPTFENDELRRVLRESVYSSEADSKRLYELNKRFGLQIIHEKNRFVLRAELTKHSKRGVMHLWNLDVHMLLSDVKDSVPIFRPFEISQYNNRIQRGGVTLDADHSRSQALCLGEVIIGEKAYPISLDLIFDISYISLVKCSTIRLQIKRSFVENEKLVMTLSIFMK